MSPLKQLTTSFEERLFYPDGQHHFALVAEGFGDEGVIAEARYVVDKENPALCEFAVSVGDAWQRKGIGTTLLHTLCREASKAGLSGMYAETLAFNEGALALVRRFDCLVAAIAGHCLTYRVSKPLRPE